MESISFGIYLRGPTACWSSIKGKNLRGALFSRMLRSSIKTLTSIWEKVAIPSSSWLVARGKIVRLLL